MPMPAQFRLPPDLQRIVDEAKAEVERWPDWMKALIKEPKCQTCKDTGSVDHYEPSPVASNPWIKVGCPDCPLGGS